jgi:hypothetical protein
MDFVMRKLRSMLTGLVLATVVSGALSVAQAPSSQQGTSTPPGSPAVSQTVPVMDGGAGPCSVELTVTKDGKPVAAASVKVHIAYGFAGVRRLDLEAYTNNDGRVKFAGLPPRVRRPPLEFHSSQDQFTGTAVYDPEAECHAKHGIALVSETSTHD